MFFMHSFLLALESGIVGDLILELHIELVNALPLSYILVHFAKEGKSLLSLCKTLRHISH